MIRGFYPSDVRSCMGARALAAIGDRTSQWHWYHCATTLAQTQGQSAFDLRYWSLLLAGALTLASAFAFALVLRFDRPPVRVLRGRKLLTGAAARRAFAQTSKAESRLSGPGLEFLPGLTVSRERETRHWLIWGGVGAGKTQTMLHLILAAIARGDGVLVLDVKGDMTAKLPGEALLVAPQDQRSLVWNVASDCRTKQDARELATRLIPKSDDPIWSDAARDILVACVAALQATKPERWSWHDLHKAAISFSRKRIIATPCACSRTRRAGPHRACWRRFRRTCMSSRRWAMPGGTVPTAPSLSRIGLRARSPTGRSSCE
jgi:hypothetical protein